jgi:hypothetical protein
VSRKGAKTQSKTRKTFNRDKVAERDNQDEKDFGGKPESFVCACLCAFASLREKGL